MNHDRAVWRSWAARAVVNTCMLLLAINGGVRLAGAQSPVSGKWVAISQKLERRGQQTKSVEVAFQRRASLLELEEEATRLYQRGDEDVWTRPLADGGVAVGIFNRGSAPQKITLPLKNLQLGDTVPAQDVWRHEAVSFRDGQYQTTLRAHQVLMLRISEASQASGDMATTVLAAQGEHGAHL